MPSVKSFRIMGVVANVFFPITHSTPRSRRKKWHLSKELNGCIVALSESKGERMLILQYLRCMIVVSLWATFALASHPAQADRSAMIKVDGSSTVYPVTEAVAEEFQNANRGKIRVTVGIAGTGGGFKKFCRGEIDIADASRPILKEEMALCQKGGITYYGGETRSPAQARHRRHFNRARHCRGLRRQPDAAQPSRRSRLHSRSRSTASDWCSTVRSSSV